MATKTEIERGGGNANSFRQPVLVYNDPEAPLSELDAAAAAIAAAPDFILGTGQDGTPDVERLTEWACRVTVNYNPGDYLVWTSTARSWFSGRARGWSGGWAPQVARYPGGAYDFGGLVFPNGRQGGSQPAPVANVGTRYKTNIATANLTNFRLAARMANLGAVHNAVEGGYQIGELALVQFNVQQVDSTQLQVDVGWSYVPNVSGETRGGVSNIAYLGHDYVWETQSPITDRNGNQIAQEVQAVYVSRPRPMADVVSITGTTPP